MTRQELLERLQRIQTNLMSGKHCWAFDNVNALIEDIELDGVLDVQCPKDIAVTMKLPGASLP